MASPRRLSTSTLPALVAGSPPGRLVVALSGGADSAALAWAAARSDRSVRAIHVDHRRPGSSRLAAAASDIAARLGLPLAVATIPDDVRFSEASARHWRYRLLDEDREADELVVTGHTGDDVAETMLMHLARGAGLDGLSGIPERRGSVFRPFLGVRRSETREVATAAGLPWVDDPDNVDPAFLRSRIRSMLRAQWDQSAGRGAIDGLIRSAALMRDEGAELDRMAERAVIARPHSLGVDFVLGELMAAGPVLANRAVRNAVRGWTGTPAGRAVTDAVESAVAGHASRFDVGGGWTVVVEAPLVRLIRPDDQAAPGPVSIEGAGVYHWGGWTIEVYSIPAPTPFPLTARAAVLDHGVLTVRAVSATDRVPVAGGTRSVGEVLADAGIPSTQHHRFPVVVADGRPVWVPGVRRWPGSSDPASDRYLWAVADRGPV